MSGVYYLIKENRSRLTPEESSEDALRLLASLLRMHLGIAGLPKIVRETSGKPRFSSLPDLHFSLSHCNSAVMAVIASSSVGCDIEDMQLDCPSELIELVCTPAEQQSIEISSTPAIEFTKIWTRKEACVKKAGIIPENPVEWRSDSPVIVTTVSADTRYVFSIACDLRVPFKGMVI